MQTKIEYSNIWYLLLKDIRMLEIIPYLFRPYYANYTSFVMKCILAGLQLLLGGPQGCSM